MSCVKCHITMYVRIHKQVTEWMDAFQVTFTPEKRGLIFRQLLGVGSFSKTAECARRRCRRDVVCIAQNGKVRVLDGSKKFSASNRDDHTCEKILLEQVQYIFSHNFSSTSPLQWDSFLGHRFQIAFILAGRGQDGS